jgi:hypothetical protein
MQVRFDGDTILSEMAFYLWQLWDLERQKDLYSHMDWHTFQGAFAEWLVKEYGKTLSLEDSDGE